MIPRRAIDNWEGRTLALDRLVINHEEIVTEILQNASGNKQIMLLDSDKLVFFNNDDGCNEIDRVALTERNSSGDNPRTPSLNGLGIKLVIRKLLPEDGKAKYISKTPDGSYKSLVWHSNWLVSEWYDSVEEEINYFNDFSSNESSGTLLQIDLNRKLFESMYNIQEGGIVSDLLDETKKIILKTYERKFLNPSFEFIFNDESLRLEYPLNDEILLFDDTHSLKIRLSFALMEINITGNRRFYFKINEDYTFKNPRDDLITIERDNYYYLHSSGYKISKFIDSSTNEEFINNFNTNSGTIDLEMSFLDFGKFRESVYNGLLPNLSDFFMGIHNYIGDCCLTLATQSDIISRVGHESFQTYYGSPVYVGVNYDSKDSLLKIYEAPERKINLKLTECGRRLIRLFKTLLKDLSSDIPGSHTYREPTASQSSGSGSSGSPSEPVSEPLSEPVSEPVSEPSSESDTVSPEIVLSTNVFSYEDEYNNFVPETLEESETREGYIYSLTDPTRPGYIKLGQSTYDLSIEGNRRRSGYRDRYFPLGTECVKTIHVLDRILAERLLFSKFGRYKIGETEWFYNIDNYISNCILRENIFENVAESISPLQENSLVSGVPNI